MLILRRFLVFLLCCLPLLTLFHQNDLRRWDFNRCLMAAPDEPSYLLMAQSIAVGDGISTTALFGRDTFYPPGYPAILALWGKFCGFSLFSMHVCTAFLSVGSMFLAYLLIRTLLRSERAMHTSDSNATALLHNNRSVENWSILLLALCVCNWYVLEGSLFAFSEPAFMFATFAWLLLMLRWRNWYTSWWQTLLVALLAIAAYSIRGAGIVCVATTFLYPLFSLLRHFIFQDIPRKFRSLGIILLVTIAYMITLHFLSPNKSLAAGAQSDNSYSQQLLRGLTDAHAYSFTNPFDWPKLVRHLLYLMASHITDFSNAFVPQYRFAPQLTVLNPIGKFTLFFAFAGLVWRILSSRKPEKERELLSSTPPRSPPFDLGRFLWKILLKLSGTGPQAPPRALFVELFALLYIALYLLWPFNMSRFWTTLLPIMFPCALIALKNFGGRHDAAQTTRYLALVFFSLLLLLNVQEVVNQFPAYQRRVNYVSDSIVEASSRIVRISPDKSRTTVLVFGGDEHFLLAWYLPHVNGGGASSGGLPTSPIPAEKFFEPLLIRTLQNYDPASLQRIFAFSYFTHQDMLGAFENVRKSHPQLIAQFEIRKIYQKEIITAVWEFVPTPVIRGAPTINSPAISSDAPSGS